MRRRLVLSASVLALAAAVPVVALAAGSPTVTTGSASGVGRTSATVHGTVNPNGGSTTYAFQFGTTKAYGSQTRRRSAGAGSSAVSEKATLTGLRPGTSYHFRILATNASGTSAGRDRTFRTTGTAPVPKVAPTVTTQPVTATLPHGTTLNGTINPNNLATTYHFEFGLTTVYGTQTTAQTLPASTTPAAVTGVLTGLESRQTYHYRLVATNAGGTTVGADATFRTGPFRPRVTARTTPRHDRRRPYVFTTRGTISGPAAVGVANGCRGRVAVRFRVGRRTVSLRHARVTPTCTYRSRVRFSMPSRLGNGRMRVSVRFLGNGALTARRGPTHHVRAG